MEENLDRIENLLRLAAEAKDGRPEALEELLTESAGIVHAFVRSRLGDTLVADEATQTALVRAARGLAGLKAPRTFPAWLRTIALRAASDAARKAVDPLVDRPVEAVDDCPGPALAAERAERADRVRRAVAELPVRLRDPVLLAYAEDLSYRDIARLLGTSAATVTRRIAAARDRLRERLGDDP